MIGIFKKRIKKRRGFTLVELIVVLLILAILAAILVPALLGYIDKAREKSLVMDAKEIWTAARTSISEQYGDNNFLDDSFKSTTVKNDEYGIAGNTKVAVVSNYALYYITTKPSEYLKKENTYKIAHNVVKYLDGKYSFKKDTNPKGTNCTTYEKNNNQPGILITYDKSGQIVFVEFGHNGVLVHIDGISGKIIIKKNGNFASL